MTIVSIKPIKTGNNKIIEQKIQNTTNTTNNNIEYNTDQYLEEFDLNQTLEKKPKYPRLEGVTNINIDNCNKTIQKYKDKDIKELTDQEFKEYIAAEAQLAYIEDGILPSVTIAQAILESEWGDKPIGNNLFGIKKSSDWKGKTIKKKTREQDENGNYYTITAEFKDYDTISDGVKDHNKLLNKPWNKPVRDACDNNDPYEACRQLYKCGYATSHTYSDELIDIINDYNLTQYDPKYE